MKITFFGSSHGIPEPHRRCSCTLIEIGDSRYFIDMGMMPIEELVNRGIAVDSVKAVFITHMHGDHTNGLISFVDLCSWVYKTAEPKIFLPKLKGKEIIYNWLETTGTKAREFEFAEVSEGVIFDDGVLKVTAVRTKHCDVSFAFVLEAEGNIDQSKVYLPHMAAGVGLKVAMNENFVLSVDWAMSLNKQDNAKWANFYIKMGYLF